MYLAVRKYMRNADLLMWHSRRFIGEKIQAVTGYEENHVSQVIILPMFENRVFSIEALDDGLHMWPLSDLLKNYDGWCEWYPVLDKYKGGPAVDSTRWLLSRLGRPYDWHSCVSHWREMIGLKPKLADDKYLYCSESSFLSWQRRQLDDPSKLMIGAGLSELQGIKYSPVPGPPMIELGIWDSQPGRRILDN